MTNNKKSLAAWFEEKYGKRPSAADPAPAAETEPAAASPESAPETALEAAPAEPSPTVEAEPATASPESAPETALEAAPAEPSPAPVEAEPATASPEPAPETVLEAAPAEPSPTVEAEPAAASPEPAPETVLEAAPAEPSPASLESESAPETTSEASPAPVGEEAKPPSLYEQLGGRPAVDAAVDIFYRKVLADGRISHFFDDVDMEKQATKQKAFLTMAFGGPHHYTGKDMREAHAHLANRSWKNYGLARQLQTQRKRGGKGKVERGLKDSHFDAVLENLRDTLAEMGVAEPLIAEVIAIAESTRNDVLGR